MVSAAGPIELHVYDFDGTLFKSPFPPDWWHGSWWDRPDSLLPPCVPQDPDESWWSADVIASARRSLGLPGVMTILMTGRLDSAHRQRVTELLSSVGLDFKSVHMRWGGTGSKAFKVEMLGRFLKKYPTIDIVRMWEDRAEHVDAFRDAVEGVDVEFDLHLVDTLRNPVECGPEDFMENAFSEGKLLREFPQDGASVNRPYTLNRSPGFGWGSTGGYRYVKPNHGAFGGNRLEQNPVKPYSDEFSDHLDDQRDDSWNAAVERFLQGIEDFKKNIGMAKNATEIGDIIADLSGGGYDASEDIVHEHGTYESHLRSGDIHAAKRMLEQGIDSWADSIIEKSERLDRDAAVLDELTYSPGEYSITADRGAGKASWS